MASLRMCVAQLKKLSRKGFWEYVPICCSCLPFTNNCYCGHKLYSNTCANCLHYEIMYLEYVFFKCDVVVVAEWLRRQTRNLLGSARAGSNPANDGFGGFCDLGEI